MQHPQKGNAEQPKCRVMWATNSCKKSFVDMIFARLVLLFTDVICLFLDDFASHEEALQLLQKWVNAGGNITRKWKPTLILITKRLEMVRDVPDTAAYCIQHVTLEVSRMKHGKLKTIISEAAQRVRRQRSTYSMLFSASHLNPLFVTAIQHTSESAVSEFDFIKATRVHNTLDDQFVLHIRTFLELCEMNQVSQKFSLRYIASALVMDSLPPCMHCRSDIITPELC